MESRLKPKPEGRHGRAMCEVEPSDKTQAKTKRLMEWCDHNTRPSFDELMAKVERRIPTTDDIHRPEEVHTLKITFREQSRANRSLLLYECTQRPTSLREVLKHVHKPRQIEDRRNFARAVVTQVRSLHFHFEVIHGALRAHSFVFFVQPYTPDFRQVYVADWAGAPSRLHQHPDYVAHQAADNPMWFHDAWAMAMVLTEISEWKPLDYDDEAESAEDEGKLRQRKLARAQTAMSDEWKGRSTATIFRYLFGVLGQDVTRLKAMSKWDVKKFYDQLCEMFDKME